MTVGLTPDGRLRRLEADAIGRDAQEGDRPRPQAFHLVDEDAAPARSSSVDSSAAVAVVRATRLVMPMPYRGSSSCSDGSSTRSVKPAPWIAFQNRLPGRAKWNPVAPEYSPGLMPTNSTSSPGPMRSGMVRSVAAASSARGGDGVRVSQRGCPDRPWARGELVRPRNLPGCRSSGLWRSHGLCTGRMLRPVSRTRLPIGVM